MDLVVQCNAMVAPCRVNVMDCSSFSSSSVSVRLRDVDALIRDIFQWNSSPV